MIKTYESVIQVRRYTEFNEHIMTEEEAAEFLAEVASMLAEQTPGWSEEVTAEQIIAEIDAADDEAS